SAFLDSNGRALGVLSTLEVGIPDGVVNGVGDIRRELDYMKATTDEFDGVVLAPGTEPFNKNKLPLGGLL
ncbi:MAG TPA: serine protease, partial [Actinomycetota bacterium]|nr:serine protease [Actinomycetota bacterium]